MAIALRGRELPRSRGLRKISVDRPQHNERNDRDIADIFAVQEEIAQRVVVSIEPEVNRAERQRALRTRPENLSAWDLALKALSLQERMSRAGLREARETLDHALKLDPALGLAWSLLSAMPLSRGDSWLG